MSLEEDEEIASPPTVPHYITVGTDKPIDEWRMVPIENFPDETLEALADAFKVNLLAAARRKREKPQAKTQGSMCII